jgi:type I restriction enzyme R subunit
MNKECVILAFPHFSEKDEYVRASVVMKVLTTTENLIERDLIAILEDLKYTYRPDIRDREALEKNFREKFETLNRIRLTDAEFQILLEQITTPDVFAAAKTLRERNSFTRDDGTPLNYTLVNIKDWCKNTFEVVNQLRINTEAYGIETLSANAICESVALASSG